MRNWILLTGLSLFAFLCFSCQKDEVIERDVYQDTVIIGNTYPPYDGVSSITVRNFINRAYIDLLGRSATEAETEAAMQALYADSLSGQAKLNFALELTAHTGYYRTFHERYNERILLGADSFEVVALIATLDLLISQAYADSNEQQAAVLEYEREKMVDLREAPWDYQQGSIPIETYFHRMVYNLIYDDINMGSENFVIACFEHFFHRQPTASEREAGVSMVDGFSSQLFLQNGSSKFEFVEIITHDDEFYEGLVRVAYRELLDRDPYNEEIAEHAGHLLNNGDYKTVQANVVKSEAYAGF